MKESKESEALETEASQLIDKAASDEGKLDKAAELLAEAEKLKGPISQPKTADKAETKSEAKAETKAETKSEAKGETQAETKSTGAIQDQSGGKAVD